MTKAKPAADTALLEEINELRKLSVSQLRERHLELFGEENTSRNKDYLFKRIAYRIQERKYGGLTARARARAELLAEDAPIRRRLTAGAEVPQIIREPLKDRDPRLPYAGSEIRRMYDGTEHFVTVLEDSFVLRGKHYKSLSTIAREITGTRWNGFGFFGLLGKASK